MMLRSFTCSSLSYARILMMLVVLTNETSIKTARLLRSSLLWLWLHWMNARIRFILTHNHIEFVFRNFYECFYVELRLHNWYDLPKARFHPMLEKHTRIGFPCDGVPRILSLPPTGWSYRSWYCLRPTSCAERPCSVLDISGSRK